MADKEATVYIVDVGRSMGKKCNGRTESDLDWAMTYVWDKITSTVATERKTLVIGIVGLRTDGSANELDQEESFQNITVLQGIRQLLLPDLKVLRPQVKSSETNDGDAISAIVIAIQMIIKYCKKLKYIRKIVLVTNARGSMDGDGLPDIITKIKEEGIDLLVVGVDFDDLEYGFKEENKEHRKRTNEELLKTLTDSCNGVFGTMQQAIEELGVPRLKSTRPTPSYKGQITLGNPLQYPTACCIDVERYPRTMIRRPLPASRFVQRSSNGIGLASATSSATVLPDADDPDTMMQDDPNGLTSVRSTRTYQIPDESAPGGKRDVERDQLAKGYEYGRTAVHISESDENVTKLETQAGLEIIGFIPWSSYERYMSMSVSSVVIGQKTNTKAIMALSSLIHALFELESYVVARLVPKVDKSPLIVLLAPSIEADYECLLDVQLPFAEDMRSYKFPPLDRVITVSGKVIKEHRNLPTDALSSAMSDYVDRMDLSTLGQDDEGNPAEYMPMMETYSPILHRIDQAVRWRAVHPNEPIPPPYEVLTRYSQPPDKLVADSKRQLEKLMLAANVKKGIVHHLRAKSQIDFSPVPPKVQSRKRRRNEAKPLSGLDVDALLGKSSKKAQISPQNPIPEFRQVLDKAEDASSIRDAVAQLATIIETQIRDSFSDINYGRAIEEITVMRDEMIELEEPVIYDEFIRALKRKLLAGELGGDRREMWAEIRKNHLGLVENRHLESSKVSEEEAKEFLSAN
ncbi:X-ray repair cross-complementing protein 5 [Pseudocyphellaria aurata]|nr:X-ray repair cross-complementing protein 5 [Pseudocyphellaria aurata]